MLGVEPEHQRNALDVLLLCLDPIELYVEPNISKAITPRAWGFESGTNNDLREIVEGYTGRSFDPFAAPEIAASLVLDSILVHNEVML